MHGILLHCYAFKTLHCLKCDNIVTSQYSCKHMSPIKSSCLLARNVFFYFEGLKPKRRKYNVYVGVFSCDVFC